jgi:hypothetical protein
MQLPYGLDLKMMQTRWRSILNPFLQNPANNASILKNISLKTGTNTVNTLLGRPLQGWSIVRQRSAASVYDNQDSNQSPELTLILQSNADVSVDILVF